MLLPFDCLIPPPFYSSRGFLHRDLSSKGERNLLSTMVLLLSTLHAGHCSDSGAEFPLVMLGGTHGSKSKGTRGVTPGFGR
jgi:hypothetical protein